MDQERKDRIRRNIEDLQSLYKAEISGNLIEYFSINNINGEITWRKNLQEPIKEKVIAIVNKEFNHLNG